MSTAYPLFSISFLVIFFYTISALLARTGILSKVNHRKIWNFVLLIAFLATSLIGLLMVVKINYKLELPYYEELLNYHVDFGIGLAIVGFVHLWWHLDYYLRLLKGEKKLADEQSTMFVNDLDAFALKSSSFLLGCTSMIAQVILLREFLSVFSGNELVLGVVLANWMILTGIGASLGKNPTRLLKASSVIISALLILTALPILTAFFLNFLRNRIFQIGAMINIFQIFVTSLLFLIPFCLVSGFLFTFISKCYSELKEQNTTGSVYGFESLGSLTGGLISGLIFIFVFSSLESLLVMAIINPLLIFWLCLKKGAPKLAWGALIVFFVAGISLFFNPEKEIRSFVYPNQEIEVSKDSPYGNIVITRRGNMWSVYNNSTLQFDSENFMFNEEAVHFAMLQHAQPSSILLVSGGLSGQLAELQKYDPSSIDYVEADRWLLSLMKDSLTPHMTTKTTLYQTDPLRFIRNATKKYDVAILNLPGPTTLQSNRFYTLEFFDLLKEKLAPGAVVSFGLPAPANYMNKEAVELNSTIFSTVKKVFSNVIIIPGEKNYFLASDGPLTYEISKSVLNKGIVNRYVNQFYFDDLLLKSRGMTILLALNQSAQINQNLKPLVYQQELAYLHSYFQGKYWWLLGVAGLLALFTFFTGNTASKVMFISGFSATGMEILLLFGLQICFGNIYLLTSFVFTGFMSGLPAGSLTGKSLKITDTRRYLPFIQMLIGLCALLSALLLFSPKMATFSPTIVYLLFLTSTVVIGYLTGFQFTNSTLIQSGSYAGISGRTYSYDLFGSALGALLLTVYLVPKIGITASAFSLGFLNLIFGIYLTLIKKG